MDIEDEARETVEISDTLLTESVDNLLKEAALKESRPRAAPKMSRREAIKAGKVGGKQPGGGRPKGTKTGPGSHKKHVKFNQTRKKRFLMALAEHGNIRAAASAAGVSKFTIYLHSDKYPEFKQAIEDAKDECIRNLEDELSKRLYGGLETIEYDAEGNIIKRTVKKDNELLKVALRANDPERYSERHSGITVNVDAGGAINKLANFLKVELPGSGSNGNELEGTFNRIEHDEE